MRRHRSCLRSFAELPQVFDGAPRQASNPRTRFRKPLLFSTELRAEGSSNDRPSAASGGHASASMRLG